MAAQHPDREAGAWIGQHEDENTEHVERTLDPGAERVAVTNNESDDSGVQEDSPHGHREPSSER
jgi:hypothetical protein